MKSIRTELEDACWNNVYYKLSNLIDIRILVLYDIEGIIWDPVDNSIFTVRTIIK